MPKYLRKSKVLDAKFGPLLRAVPDAMAIVDTDGRIVLMNTQTETLFGYTRAELLGQVVEILVPQRFRERHATHRDGYSASPRVRSMGSGLELYGLRKDGTEFPVEINLSHMETEGEMLAVAAIRNVSERRRAEEVVRQSQKRYESLVNAIDGIVWEAEVPSFRFTFVSRQAERLLGYPLRAWLDEPNFWKDHIHPDDRDWALAYCQKQTTEKNAHQFDYRILTADGRTIWMRDYVSVIVENNQPVKLQGVMVDITGTRTQKQKIIRLNRVYAVLSGINAMIVRVKDRQELFNETCRIAVENGGFRQAAICLVDEATGEIKTVAAAGEDAAPLAQMKLSAPAVGAPDEQSTAGEALRSRRPVVLNDIGAATDPAFKDAALAHGFRSLAVLPLIVEGVAMGVLVLYAGETGFFDEDEMKLLNELAADISFALEHIKKQEQLDYLAYYDALTGLPNRRLFYDRLGQALQAAAAENKKMALVLVDLVNFKLINDSLGQHSGDAVLREFAARLCHLLPGDVTLARVSGDVFALGHAGPGNIVDIAQPLVEKILGACGSVLKVAEHEVRLYVKLGIAVSPGDGANSDTLFKNAEAALKKAKHSVETSLYYSPEMNARVSESLAMRNKLRRALDEQQFVLHFQPIHEAGNGRICGAEALVRWNDPETGLVPPMQFIPLLEETGMILDLGHWVLEKAMSLHTQWQAEGLTPPRISVNVSAIQLRHKGFVNEITDVVGKTGSMGLDVEITESVMMEDVERNIGKLQTVRDMGMEIAIDDFGTGYSSLSYLSKLPINSLKIDRAFIMNLAANPNDMTLVSTIVSLAHALNLKVVAEGVETEGQSNLLKLLRCDMMQGYLFSRPLPAGEFETLLRQPARARPN